MNHQKFYDSIVNNAKSQNRIKLKINQEGYIYYESHHIFPKCLGGSNEKENLVLLTAREHYICHKLLMFIHPNNRGIILSFIRMLYSKNFEKINSSKDYEIAKKFLSKQMTGRKLTDEHKKNIGKGVKGKIKGIHKSITAKKNMSNARKKYLNTHINPLLGTKRPWQSESQRGENNPMYGKKLSEEAKQKIRDKLKGKKRIFKIIECEYCHKKSNIGNYTRWHGKNCKHKNNDLDMIDI